MNNEKMNNFFHGIVSKVKQWKKQFSNSVKKSEVLIYAIALMLVTAGYFNYTNFNKDVQEVSSQEMISETNEHENIGDAVLVNNDEIQEENINFEENVQEPINNEVSENITNTNTETTEEFQNVSTSSNLEETTNYYANSKLDRDKMYAEMISSYQQILNNTNTTEAQKSIATQEIAKINNTKNAIMICENLILTKSEFKDCVILVNDDSVNVVISIENGLATESVAKIQNIISREMGTEIENIHITEK